MMNLTKDRLIALLLDSDLPGDTFILRGDNQGGYEGTFEVTFEPVTETSDPSRGMIAIVIH